MAIVVKSGISGCNICYDSQSTVTPYGITLNKRSDPTLIPD